MLSWRIRYHRLIESNPELNDPNLSVVEVGSAGFSIANLLTRNVVVIDPDPAVQNRSVIKGNVLELPLADGEVDVVLCLDILARLAPAQRVAALAELTRVARRKVLISCPCHKPALQGERQLAASLARHGQNAPAKLTQHLQNGLPSIQEILDPIIAGAYEFEVCGNETLTQHYAAVMLDIFHPQAAVNNRIHLSKAGWQAPIEGNSWDLYYSFLFTIHKTRQRRAPRTPAPSTASLSSPLRFQIYAAYHKNFPTDHLRCITPIFVGDDPQDRPPRAIDASGSLDNRRWSELSAMFHVWRRGEKLEIIGFCHYRRLFDFGAAQAGVRSTDVPWAEAENFRHRMLDPDIIAQCAAGAVITALPEDLGETIFDWYSLCHNTQDYLSILTDVCNRYPELADGMMQQFGSRSLYANNLFIMSWDQFDEVCKLWMDILMPFAARHQDRRVGAYQTRDLSFLAERIFDAWIRTKKQQGTKIIELPILFMY